MCSHPRYSVVVPVFGNRDTIPELVHRLGTLPQARDGLLEAVFVVDGSPDDSAEVLKECLAASSLPARVVELSRNYGSFSAIRMGLAAATGDFRAVMAADLQEPPELVGRFFEMLDAGEVDVVVGQRSARNDPGTSVFSSRLFWSLYRRWVNPDVPVGGVDVFACSAAVADRLAQFAERNTSLVGLLFWVGYRRGVVSYERQPRLSGRSGWTLRKKLRYLTDSIYAFTDLPIVILQGVGLAGFALSIVVGLAVLVGWLTGAIQEPGYTPLMLVITASTSSILLGLGVVGSYVWRTYENGKGRPVAIAMR